MVIESIVYPFVCFCHLVPTSMVAVVCNVLSVCVRVRVCVNGREGEEELLLCFYHHI